MSSSSTINMVNNKLTKVSVAIVTNSSPPIKHDMCCYMICDEYAYENHSRQ